MVEIINIFDRQVNASASALRRSLGFVEREKHPLTCFVLDSLYKRAYESEHECRNTEEIREDFTEFREGLSESLVTYKRQIDLFLGRTGQHPDFMLALCLGHEILGAMQKDNVLTNIPHLPELVDTCKGASKFLNGKLTQDDVTALKPVSLFTVLLKLDDQFHAFLERLESYNSRPNQYTLAAMQKNLGIISQFTGLTLGTDGLSQKLQEQASEISAINKQYGLSKLTYQSARL